MGIFPRQWRIQAYDGRAPLGKTFVKIKRINPVAVAEGIKFHQLMKGMHAQLSNYLFIY
jgi:hypothetical protein